MLRKMLLIVLSLLWKKWCWSRNQEVLLCSTMHSNTSCSMVWLWKPKKTLHICICRILPLENHSWKKICSIPRMGCGAAEKMPDTWADNMKRIYPQTLDRNMREEPSKIASMVLKPAPLKANHLQVQVIWIYESCFFLM